MAAPPGLYRETGDVDLGIPPVTARGHRLVDRLKAQGYDQVEGNRFARTVPGTPVKIAGGHAARQQAIIDVLVPAYTSRPRRNVQVSKNLVSTEVPGLADALGRPPVIMTLELHRLNGDTLQATLPFADEVSALVLKSLATRVRSKDTDIADIWRCLEIAFAAGSAPSDFTGGNRPEAAATVRALFARRTGPRDGRARDRTAPIRPSRRPAVHTHTGPEHTRTGTRMTQAPARR
jgi:hypothetical protein